MGSRPPKARARAQQRFAAQRHARDLRGETGASARIAAVADVFDALTSDRVYRPAFTVERAIEEMRVLRGIQFDPAMLDMFLDSLDEMLEVRALYATRTSTPLKALAGDSK